MAEINRLNLALQLTIFLALEAGLLIKSSTELRNHPLLCTSMTRLNRSKMRLRKVRRKSMCSTGRKQILEAQLLRLRQEKVRIATTIRETESQIFALERQIRKLNSQETEKISELSRRRDQFGQVLIALQRVSRVPPEAVLAYPAPPSDLVRTAILLRTAVPEIEARAQRLRENLTTLELTRDAIKMRKMDLPAGHSTPGK